MSATRADQWRAVIVDGAVEVQHSTCGNMHSLDDTGSLRVIANHECPAADLLNCPVCGSGEVGDCICAAPRVHPCGHVAIERDCGGCDPSAIDFEFGPDGNVTRCICNDPPIAREVVCRVHQNAHLTGAK